MPQYFFHVYTKNHVVDDLEGVELTDRQVARECAFRGVQELLVQAIKQGTEPPDRISVEDAEGREVLTVYTTEALPKSMRTKIFATCC